MSKTPFALISFFAITLIASAVTVVSCGDDDDKELRATVDSFSVAYFNWQFPKAAVYADTPSRRWLSYLSTQVSQEDVDSLRSMREGARVEVKGITATDTAATATVEAQGFFALDSIGRPPHIVGKATASFRLRREDGQWKVALRGL